ncbi:hypothetical protein [Bradyrhizobium canariense]|uniref:hypothetical protein n=1 Tax=Bradyrhizobium canariense TaxID=255045 RepID=UPI000A191706|nr:hypothetical protein [Bradyrhizobium canariense]OSI23400.1 hypothetical protein BST65_22185 [Bradyrhizobium canariense]OSI33039.1 hypothetical protein BST66_14200 [Bradyrhizobium canariense]OSI41199.1 hypothetical protein BSZ20_22325 [Bradyrhizobium canariense]OSI46353.1 hypothetical protein BST67_25095 [Bradyrhizobium canariense]OSI51162.1 hypothetical protein BSZ15_31220 [Bradyrhizobium canariense]
MSAVIIGVGCYTYRYFAKPVFLTVAAGSGDGGHLVQRQSQSFFDKYDDKVYYASLRLGSLISVIIAAWRFAGQGGGSQNLGEPLHELGRQ